eukprot:1282616-Rhodomonas_salina.1
MGGCWDQVLVYARLPLWCYALATPCTFWYLDTIPGVPPMHYVSTTVTLQYRNKHIPDTNGTEKNKNKKPEAGLLFAANLTRRCRLPTSWVSGVLLLYTAIVIPFMLAFFWDQDPCVGLPTLYSDVVLPPYAIYLRAWYAMPGTDALYGAICPCACYAMCSTESWLCYYVLCSTKIGYAPTSSSIFFSSWKSHSPSSLGGTHHSSIQQFRSTIP